MLNEVQINSLLALEKSENYSVESLRIIEERKPEIVIHVKLKNAGSIYLKWDHNYCKWVRSC